MHVGKITFLFVIISLKLSHTENSLVYHPLIALVLRVLHRILSLSQWLLSFFSIVDTFCQTLNPMFINIISSCKEVGKARDSSVHVLHDAHS